MTEHEAQKRKARELLEALIRKIESEKIFGSCCVEVVARGGSIYLVNERTEIVHK